MLVGRAVRINDNHTPASLGCRPQIPQKRIGRRNLVIHVNEKHTVKTVRRQIGIVGRAELHRHRFELVALDTFGKFVAHLGDDVLRQHTPLRANARGKADRIISLARANVCHGHPGFDTRAVHNAGGLACLVAAVFIGPARRHDGGDGARRCGKLLRTGFTRRRAVVAGDKEQHRGAH